MFNSCNIPYSLAVAPVSGNGNSGNGNGWGMDGGWWIVIILFALIFGWGNGGWGGNQGGNGATSAALTRGDLCMDMNFNDLEGAVRGVQQGLCDGFYAMNTSLLNGFSGIQNILCQGFAEVAAQGNANTNAIQQSLNAMNISNLQTANAQNITALQNANALQAAVNDCCCKTQAGQLAIQNQMVADTCAINNNMQNQVRDIIDNNNANTRMLYDFLVQSKIDAKDETIADLRSRLSACGDEKTAQYIVNQVDNMINPRSVPCYPGPSPCGLGNWSNQVLANYNNGCCGCGCNGNGYQF